MAYWLLKTEPVDYSYDDLVRDKQTVWEGVSNNLALKHLRSMKRGDLAFIYHTGKEKAVVGIAEVVKGSYSQTKGPSVVVDIKPKRILQKKVALSDIKSRKEFASFDLVRISRLSVMPVSGKIWNAIINMATE